MIDAPICPVCAENHWRSIGRKTYKESDAERFDSYVRDRYRVLFEIWFPGETEVTLVSQLCERCGFITNAPRPDRTDIDSKYRFLNEITKTVNLANYDDQVERRRARQLFRRLHRKCRIEDGIRVLDYGGGDGRLTRELASRNASCYLVDYSRHVTPWITRLGSTELDLADEATFDLIICSHVLEHVAEPVAVLRELSEHLGPDGTMYVEVPMEIWGRAPLHEEPVTHVNFFTPSSMKLCIDAAGLGSTSSKLVGFLHSTGRHLLAVASFAQRDRASGVPNSSTAVAESLSFLKPGLQQKLRRYAATPATIPQAFGYRVARFLGAS